MQYSKAYDSFATKYIDSYLNVRPLVTGLLMSKIMRENKVDKNEKEKIKKNLQEYLSTNDPSYLSPKCFDIMHEYYLGGYSLLLKKFNWWGKINSTSASLYADIKSFLLTIS